MRHYSAVNYNTSSTAKSLSKSAATSKEHPPRAMTRAAMTTPIFMPNSVGGYMAGQISSPSANNSAGLALAKGYVVVSPALRGRNVDNGTAPACIVDFNGSGLAVHFIRERTRTELHTEL